MDYSSSVSSRSPSPSRDTIIEISQLVSLEELPDEERGRKKERTQKNHAGQKSDAALPITKMPDNKSIERSLSAKSNDDDFQGLSEDQFREKCKEAGLSDKDTDALIHNVQTFVAGLHDLDATEKSDLTTKQNNLIEARKLPKDASTFRQIKTTAAAGSAAYLTSFLWGKLAANLAIYSSDSPRGVWAFLLAGFLNPLLTEPIVNGIRTNGAAYASPDGVAYTDYRTGKARLALAEGNQDEEGIKKWTLFCSKIVDGVIDREHQGKVWFNSGANKPKRDENGIPDLKGSALYDYYADEDLVMSNAKLRAFITDELPFYCFTANYIISGSLAPILKASFPPLKATFIDLAISAGLGTISGAETAMMQNILRKHVQGAALVVGISTEVKAAQLELTSSTIAAWEEKLLKIRQTIKVLDAEHQALLARQANGEDVESLIEASWAAQKNANVARKNAKKKLIKANRSHHHHSSQFHRVRHGVGSSMRAYMGEKSPDAKPMEGRRAINRTIAKVIAYPLSLTPICLYTSLLAPAILTATNTTVPVYNTTAESHFPNATSVEHAGASLMPVLPLLLGALAGLPLIFGFNLRIQACMGFFEALITDKEPEGPVRRQRRANADDSSIIISDGDTSSSETDSTSETDSSSETDENTQSYDQESDAPSDIEQGIVSRRRAGKLDGSSDSEDDQNYTSAADNSDAEDDSIRV